MAAGEPRQRTTNQKPAPVQGGGGGREEGEEDKGITKGLLSCIAGVGGVSFTLWLVIFVFLEPYDPSCTRVMNLEDLSTTLMKTVVMADTKWRSFGEELGLEGSQLDALSAEDDPDNTPMMGDLVIRMWYNSSKKVCFEKIVQALVNIEEVKSAELIAKKYKTKVKL